MDVEVGGAGPEDRVVAPKRRRVRRDPGQSVKGPKMSDRVTINLTISRRASMILHAHAGLYRGTPKGSASALVESLVVDHLKEVRISHHAGEGDPEGGAEGAA